MAHPAEWSFFRQYTYPERQRGMRVRVVEGHIQTPHSYVFVSVQLLYELR